MVHLRVRLSGTEGESLWGVKANLSSLQMDPKPSMLFSQFYISSITNTINFDYFQRARKKKSKDSIILDV